MTIFAQQAKSQNLINIHMKNYDEKFVFEKTDFDYVNPNALVVIVGITPGNSQLKDSREGKSLEEIKRENAFAGNMRPNLVSMLDSIGINRMLGIESCRSLWGEDFSKVEMTSLLKDATYEIKKDGTKMMFRDTSKIAKSPKLTQLYERGFIEDCHHYSKAKIFVACGKSVYDRLTELQSKGIITAPIVGIAHPSGANAGRISAYLGKKAPKDASEVWCQTHAEEARDIISEVKS